MHITTTTKLAITTAIIDGGDGKEAFFTSRGLRQERNVKKQKTKTKKQYSIGHNS